MLYWFSLDRLTFRFFHHIFLFSLPACCSNCEAPCWRASVKQVSGLAKSRCYFYFNSLTHTFIDLFKVIILKCVIHIYYLFCFKVFDTYSLFNLFQRWKLSCKMKAHWWQQFIVKIWIYFMSRWGKNKVTWVIQEAIQLVLNQSNFQHCNAVITMKALQISKLKTFQRNASHKTFYMRVAVCMACPHTWY